MRRWRSLAVLAVVLGIVPMSSALAAVYKSQTVYFHCKSPAKDDSVFVAAGDLPTWNTTPPAGAFQGDGAGCGQHDPNGGSGPADAAWKGTFKGALTSLTVSAHAIYAGSARTGSPFKVVASLEIDGKKRLTDVPVTVTAIPSDTRLSELIEFTVTGLNIKTKGTHTITLGLDSDTGTQTIWVYDATEVPSGITFNPATPAPAAQTATTPGPTAVPAPEPTPEPTPTP